MLLNISSAGLQPSWSRGRWIDALAHRTSERHFCHFELILVIGGCGISCEIAFRWMSVFPTDDESTLVQVMTWCRQATSPYLIQCWPKSTPSGVIRPQWVQGSHWFTIHNLCQTCRHNVLVPFYRSWYPGLFNQLSALTLFEPSSNWKQDYTHPQHQIQILME